jgi:glycosyltransferase involved in cell wall biosynthesis
MSIYFSIIIPAYNVEKYIDRALTSIINQSFQDFEIIIVNDGSIDKTAVIIDKYIKIHKNIKIVNHLKNDSQHIARIDGVAVSNGQYIIFMDADDYFTNNALSILYNEILINPGYDFYEFAYIKQPTKKVIFPSFTEKDRFSSYFSKDNYPENTMWNKVYNINLLKKSFANMDREYINYSEDLYESIIISFFIKKTININQIIINYSIGTGISTTNKDYNKTIEYLNAQKKTRDLINIFIKKNNISINMDNLHYRCLLSAINNINSKKNIEEKKKLYLMLLDLYDNKLVYECLINIYNSLLKSKDYIIGNKILQPLRKIKSLLKL